MKRHAIFAALAAILIAGSTFMANAATGPSPFFMFTSYAKRNSPLRAVLEKYVTSADYISLGLSRGDPRLASRVGKSHIYVLPPSVKAVQRQASQCKAGLIIYDGEHWGATPRSEQASMPMAVSDAKSATKSAGCSFGFAPDGQYAGLTPKTCSYDLNSAIHRQIDFADITLFNVQAQRLLSDSCVGHGGIDNYVKFVTTVAGEVHAKNPATKVSAQFSFRYTPPDRMIAVMKQLRGVVDGFYIAYPVGVGNITCQYCSPTNLEQVLSAINSM